MEKSRWFKVEYAKIGGGQVESTTVEFYELMSFAKQLREEGRGVYSCQEVK